MKLDFEIAVDQQTQAHDKTFEGVPDSGCPPVPVGEPRPYLVNFGSILPNDLNMLKTVLCGALLVASSLLNTYTKFYQNRIKIGRVMSKILYMSIFGHMQQILLILVHKLGKYQ